MISEPCALAGDPPYFQSFEDYPSKETLKAAFGQLPSGVVVVTSIAADNEFAGATVSSFNSLSFDPPLVALGLAQTSKTLAAILGFQHFAVHFVSEANRDLALRFASGSTSKFKDVSCKLSRNGVPLLAGFHTSIECVLDSAQIAGDHQLLIGRVLSASVGDDCGGPVAWFRRGFHSCLPVADRSGSDRRYVE
ncbi:flavin reductase domain protein FMN-binding protein [Rhizobium sp. CF080]|uniref:flavin reductase family protein n=1 Tax=Rhizobium sp. (strain CF080) TaxID=1144310 RepID=UPI000271ACAD|nr:flavin reductase family protein [Rhizobium sp. CF080]EUB99997.1 flavin reductase domain protein FMN-binding protein [Rhizobium sp. CF080]